MSTGARVGGVQPPGIPRESWLRRKTIKSEAARRVREVTDNRTNEPTPEQVEAAAVASINSHRSRAGLPTLATLDCVPNADEWRDDARAALVAAAGVAPQAPNVDRAMEIAQALAKAHTFTTASALSIANAALALAAPVQPSSTVYEAELIREAKAEAWDEGHEAFEEAWRSDHHFPYDYATDNPYRKGKNND